MYEQLTELMANFPAYLGGHILLSVTALAAGLAISLPLGIAASRRPKLAESTLGVAGVIQTVPSLALLGLAVFLLGGLIGFVPAFLTLVLYSILPILANTVVGIRGVDPALTEAARGLGMTDRQMLWRVELPLAAPIILGGIRTATVLVVGTATLATQVGSHSLGNYIFAGLSMLNNTAIILGCVAAALLAVLMDQLVHLLEIAARRRSRALGVVAAAGLLLVTAGGLYDPVARWIDGDADRGVVASTLFTEQYVLSHVLTKRLEAAGFRVDQRTGMSESIRMEALRRNQVDCLVTYSGDMWTLLMKKKNFEGPEATLKKVKRYLEEDYGVVYIGPLGFENAYALAVRRQAATNYGLTSIDDLAKYSKAVGRRLKVGGDDQIFHRPEWKSIEEKYGLAKYLETPIAMDQTRMYSAVKDEQLDVIVAYTSDGRVKAFDLQLLKDPEHVFPPYDAIVLVSPAAARRPGFVETLQPLIGTIDLDMMQEANLRVDFDEQSPARASQWLLEAIERRLAKQGPGKGVAP